MKAGRDGPVKEAPIESILFTLDGLAEGRSGVRCDPGRSGLRGAWISERAAWEGLELLGRSSRRRTTFSSPRAD